MRIVRPSVRTETAARYYVSGLVAGSIITSSFVAACSPTLAVKPGIDAIDFSIFLAWNRKPFDEAGNLDSNNRVALKGHV
jgi:hypothetical protein